jgi:hypothetical protein
MTANTHPPTPALEAAAVARMEPLRPLPIADVTSAMTQYQEGLHSILQEQDWQTFADRDGRERRFVKRNGWRKISTWFGLDLLIKSTVVERVIARVCPQCGHAYLERGTNEGDPLRALVQARAVAPNGRAAEDVGACSATERAFSKPEHDLVSTAATRALNRATANLVGMGELVSAEEAADEAEPLLPAWAQPASDELLEVMRSKLAELVGDKRAIALVRAIGERYGYVPSISTGFVNAMYSMLTPSTPEGAQ